NPVTGRRQLVAYVVPEKGADQPTESWRALLRAGAARREGEAAAAAGGLLAYESPIRPFNEVTGGGLSATLAPLGVLTASGDTADADRIVERHGLRPGYRGLIAEWLGLLAREGVLKPTDRLGEYLCDQPLDHRALSARVDQGLAA